MGETDTIEKEMSEELKKAQKKAIYEMDIVLEAMEHFMEFYKPADNLNEADETMTTSDIIDYLGQLVEIGDIKNSDIYQILDENGYKYQFTNGFTWLLKVAGEKEH